MSKLSVADLKKECKKKGIKGYSGWKKAELVKNCLNTGKTPKAKTPTPKPKTPAQAKKMSVAELKKLCKQKGVKGYSKMNKSQLEKACLSKTPTPKPTKMVLMKQAPKMSTKTPTPKPTKMVLMKQAHKMSTKTPTPKPVKKTKSTKEKKPKLSAKDKLEIKITTLLPKLSLQQQKDLAEFAFYVERITKDGINVYLIPPMEKLFSRIGTDDTVMRHIAVQHYNSTPLEWLERYMPSSLTTGIKKYYLDANSLLAGAAKFSNGVYATEKALINAGEYFSLKNSDDMSAGEIESERKLIAKEAKTMMKKVRKTRYAEFFSDESLLF